MIQPVMLQLSPRMLEVEAEALRVILANQDPNGAYMACPNFPVYRYSWLRDGAFIAEAMDRTGVTESASRFHAWVRCVLELNASKIKNLVERSQAGDTIPAEDHLPCRFNTDGSESLDEWTNFQLDGYGTWLWALDSHLTRNSLSREEWLPQVFQMVEYLSEFWQQPSFDWWEESFGHQHTSTLGCISAGLLAVSTWEELPTASTAKARFTGEVILDQINLEAAKLGYLPKWLGSTEVDSSLLALIAPMKLFSLDSSITHATVNKIEQDLVQGGVHRHRADVYYGGGQWILLTAFLAQCHLATGNVERVVELLNWIVDTSDADGALSEQSSQCLLHPEYLDSWIAKWGESAHPLLWSEAMYLWLLDDIRKGSNL